MKKTNSHIKSKKKHRNSVKSWISGAIVINKEIPIIKVVGFLAFIGLIYIASNYHAMESLRRINQLKTCLLYTSDAADDLLCVDLGGRRIIKKKKQ